MKKQAIGFVCVVLFFGILLSMTLYIGLGGFGVDSGGFPSSEYRFNRLFFSDGGIRSLVRSMDYRIFGHIENSEVIIGSEDWLYETVDSSTGFPYLMDYVSGCPYTEEEIRRIASLLESRRQEYAKEGVTYLLAVIPSTYTACGDYLPAYLGNRNENTRLSHLSRALSERGETSFLDLSPAMEASRDRGVPYHNTENSINAYGGFAVYGGILDRLGELGVDLSPHRLDREQIEFAMHYTEGKKIARRVDLEKIIPNKTVSLTNQLGGGYTLADMTEHCVCGYASVEGRSDRRVIIEFSQEWDRIQLMPFFSNTFGTVVYENRITDGREAVDYHGADLLIQILHEGELDLLLEESEG